MSRQNKVNPDHYTTAGRLSPDDLAREKWKQRDSQLGAGRRRHSKPMPPWMSDTLAAGASESAKGATGAKGARGAGAGDSSAKKTERRKVEAGKQAGAKTGRGAAVSTRRRAAPKAGQTPKTTKSQRAGRPAAQKTASRGGQKAAAKKSTARSGTAAKRSTPARVKAKKR